MKIQHDQQEDNGKFFIDNQQNKVAEMTYTLREGNMVIEHTLVDESLRGNDFGIQLIKEAANFSRKCNIKIVPECSYAKKVLERTEEYKDVLA